MVLATELRQSCAQPWSGQAHNRNGNGDGLGIGLGLGLALVIAINTLRCQGHGRGLVDRNNSVVVLDLSLVMAILHTLNWSWPRSLCRHGLSLARWHPNDIMLVLVLG